MTDDTYEEFYDYPDSSVEIDEELERKIFGTSFEQEIRYTEIFELKNLIYQSVCRLLFGEYYLHLNRLPDYPREVGRDIFSEIREGNLESIRLFFGNFKVDKSGKVIVRIRYRQCVEIPNNREFAKIFLEATKNLLKPSSQ